ncbi:hypothetical protein U0035_14145 [Niabella yanshanensis]|uniref:Haem-binding uptake Tiki superfamily ChaN domain-containing protein n=1 Tax=Niabella yanshanensis TaxID=577386 RepID=A0ABZ0W2M8_9BACT|nr:hypothetical protein [Niabella yanshanensis]WQD36809.1 hypothetical protein U0035_14145 [Niabella yanshanensis]
MAQSHSVTIMGNVHYPSKQFNADTLETALERIKPDIILLELDSSLFNKTFDDQYRLKYASRENEPVAVARYIQTHPATTAVPFDFENRDAYRKEKGIKQGQNKIEKLLDSLYNNKLLSKDQSETVENYYALTKTLNAYAEKPIAEFNSLYTDSIAKLRQYYQHHEIKKLIDQRKEFIQRFVTTSSGVTISWRDAYKNLSDFWDLRNKTMAQNIIRVADKYPAKRIVVLTGFFHRYYLLAEIKRQAPHIQLEDFFNLPDSCLTGKTEMLVRHSNVVHIERSKPKYSKKFFDGVGVFHQPANSFHCIVNHPAFIG